MPDAGSEDAGRWEPLGSPLGHDTQVYPAVAADPSGTVFVAYAALAAGPGIDQTELRVARWSGSAWIPVGGVVASSGTRLPYSDPLWLGLATDGAGRLMVAFGDTGPGLPTGPLPLKTWTFDGSMWQPVPVPGTAKFLNGLSLLRGADGVLRLAVASETGLRLWILVSGTWTEATSPLPTPADAGVSQPALGLAPDGTPVVVFDRARVAGEVGALQAVRWTDGGWSDLGLPSPGDAETVFYGPRVVVRADGGVVVAAAQWIREATSHLQNGVAVPLLTLGAGGWSLVDLQAVPGGAGLSEPVAGAPIGLALQGDAPVVVFTRRDGGTELRALTAAGEVALAPPLDGVMAGTLVLDSLGTPVVGGVTPQTILDAGLPAVDGGASEVLRVVPR
jgi:hypothetical protein